MKLAYLAYGRSTLPDLADPLDGMAFALFGWQFGREAAKVGQLWIDYDPQPRIDSGSPHEAVDEVTGRSSAGFLTAGRLSAATRLRIRAQCPRRPSRPMTVFLRTRRRFPHTQKALPIVRPANVHRPGGRTTASAGDQVTSDLTS